jgi:NifU-like protein involved in Fe-S cluster formation
MAKCGFCGTYGRVEDRKLKVEGCAVGVASEERACGFQNGTTVSMLLRVCKYDFLAEGL